ncbi:MAG: hypothetical protein ACREDR_20915, partial [Blastocatellia bacterium]
MQGKIYQVQDTQCMRNALLTMSLQTLKSITLPVTESGKPVRQFTFTYNSDSTFPTSQTYQESCGAQPLTVTVSSTGMGELSQILTPSNATVNYTYSADGEANILGPEAATEDFVTTKSVSHDGTQDQWTYGVSSVTDSVQGPDGLTVTEDKFQHPIGAPGYQGGSSGVGGLVYRTTSQNASSKALKIVERHWTALVFNGSNSDAPGGEVTFNPVVDAEYTTVTDPTGQKPSMMNAKTYQFDFNGNVTQEKDYDWFAPPTSAGRDSFGVPTGVPSGAVLLRTIIGTYYNSPVTPGNSNVYAEQPVTSSTPLIENAIQEQTISGTGSDIQYSYDLGAFGKPPLNGNLTLETRNDDIDGLNVTIQHSYDALGNLLTTTDPDGNVTTYAYTDSTHALPISVMVDPKNGTGTQTSMIAYDFSTGLPVSKTDVNGKITTIDYTNLLLNAVDPFGRPGTVTLRAITTTIGGTVNTGQSRTSSTSYYDSELQVAVLADLSTAGDGLLKTRTTVDQLGRTIKTETSEDGTTNYSISAQAQYFQYGRITMNSNAMRSGASSTDGWTRTTRDEIGRVAEVASFSGAAAPPSTTTNANWTGSITTAYAANTTTVTDQAGNSRSSTIDGLGRLVQVAEDPFASNLLTNYSYDPLGNLTTVN